LRQSEIEAHSESEVTPDDWQDVIAQHRDMVHQLMEQQAVSDA